MVTTFTGDYFDAFKDEFMQALIDRLSEMQKIGVGEFCDFFDLGTVLTVNMCTSDQNLQELEIGNARFDINSNE